MLVRMHRKHFKPSTMHGYLPRSDQLWRFPDMSKRSVCMRMRLASKCVARLTSAQAHSRGSTGAGLVGVEITLVAVRGVDVTAEWCTRRTKTACVASKGIAARLNSCFTGTAICDRLYIQNAALVALPSQCRDFTDERVTAATLNIPSNHASNILSNRKSTKKKSAAAKTFHTKP